MKRPRRPQKAKPAKRAVKKIDFKLDDVRAPKGLAYQWVADPKIDPHRECEWSQAIKAGWKPVSSKRHPKFPAKRGRVAFGAMVLMQISEKRKRALVEADIARAKAQMKEYRDLFRMDGREGDQRFPLVSPDFMVSSAYESVPPDAESVDIPVMIKLRMTRRFQDAAAALRLSVEQSAQRRITLFLRGDLGGLLLPAPPDADGWPESVEIHEQALFTITAKV